jgi:hypothetical protein
VEALICKLKAWAQSFRKKKDCDCIVSVVIRGSPTVRIMAKGTTLPGGVVVVAVAMQSIFDEIKKQRNKKGKQA